MTQYVYQPLDESNDEIRLITLLPAADRDSDVICNISIVRLTEEDVPKYEALSYTWGSVDSRVRLRVSPDSDHSIDITRNLAEALPYLRDPVAPRVLWIDAIAINQKDLSERGQQVQRMADIFSLAERVIVWLGLDDADSKIVMETCEFLHTKVEFDYEGLMELRGLSDQPYDAHWSDAREQLPYDTATWQAIVNFLRRPWFHRLWIWQEIRLSRPKAIMMCGTDTMHWTQLRTLLNCIGYKGSLTPSGLRGSGDFRTLVTNGRYLASFIRPPLFVLLTMMRHSRCIDPRDRVYGILGILSKTNVRMNLRPDYERPVIDIYMDLMMYYIHKSNRLDLLRLCQYDETMGNRPSWIPDLTNLRGETNILSQSSGSSACQVVLLQNRVLRVTGIRLGRLTRADPFVGSYEDCNSNIRRWAKSLDMAFAYVDGKSMAEAFCLAVRGGAISDVYVPPFEMFPTVESTLAFLHDILRLRDNEFAASEISNQMFSLSYRRAFFTTSSGHIGLGPSGAREGDHVCGLLGCEVPVVIRADSHGRYKIIGDCYVPGLGSNEAFLGPLPRGFKEVAHYDAESVQRYWTFLHSESGKIQVEDPKLGTEIPPGWQRKTDLHGQFWAKFNRESAPDTWTWDDPRLTKSELLKRGVPLEDIEFL